MNDKPKIKAKGMMNIFKNLLTLSVMAWLSVVISTAMVKLWRHLKNGV